MQTRPRVGYELFKLHITPSSKNKAGPRKRITSYIGFLAEERPAGWTRSFPRVRGVDVARALQRRGEYPSTRLEQFLLSLISCCRGGKLWQTIIGQRDARASVYDVVVLAPLSPALCPRCCTLCRSCGMIFLAFDASLCCTMHLQLVFCLMQECDIVLSAAMLPAAPWWMNILRSRRTHGRTSECSGPRLAPEHLLAIQKQVQRHVRTVFSWRSYQPLLMLPFLLVVVTQQ